MNSGDSSPELRPEILAPAGDRHSFLAAIAAGADAIYCGLKHFSARMEAGNFSVGELASLTALAREKQVRVHVAMNGLLKPGEMEQAGRLLHRLAAHVRPHALILQDLGILALARQAGLDAEMHLSTLANVSFARALPLVRSTLGVDRVILPRELTVDEIRAVCAAAPPGIELEVFVHGALCYAVSGRCYWSSFFGGKSGLRGRCVQPCRRLYRQGKAQRRFFSCMDLSLDILARTLLSEPRIRSWKIEGRKKGPHYVFYTVTAYRLLRDHPSDPQAKRDAIDLLSRALGRKGTHYAFLPQSRQIPMPSDDQTGSGLFLGRATAKEGSLFLRPRQPLLSGDLLRVGNEEDAWHKLVKIRKPVPKAGRIDLPGGKGVPAGTPVFLLDRREPELSALIHDLERQLTPEPSKAGLASDFRVRLPRPASLQGRPQSIELLYDPGVRKLHGQTGLWLTNDNVRRISRTLWPRIWWWLPPVIWPEEEGGAAELAASMARKGGRTFVLGAPWQASFFAGQSGLALWAGPFCNMANPLAIEEAGRMGINGVIVSPELSGEDFLQLPGRSPLPLGIVLKGLWPLCIARTVPPDLKSNAPFLSPKGETAWTRKMGSNLWVYPDWSVDLTSKQDELARAGYRLFVHMLEQVPRSVALRQRPGLWNWEHGLL
jgi:U32 family peptidase